MSETLFKTEMKMAAVLSKCGRYRYWLSRIWDDGKPAVVFLMLNPSKADAMVDDPTIRRCIGFAKAWGFGGIVVRNLFNLRATDPKELYADADPIGGDDGEVAIEAMCWGREEIVAAWGCHGAYKGRDASVCRRLSAAGKRVMCLGVTKDGHPKHPLYLAANTKLVPFELKGGSDVDGE